jgi:hypothetical protein
MQIAPSPPDTCCRLPRGTPALQHDPRQLRRLVVLAALVVAGLAGMVGFAVGRASGVATEHAGR